MKIKERALSLLLSLVMVLTFMPVLTFAEEVNEQTDLDNTPVVEETTKPTEDAPEESSIETPEEAPEKVLEDEILQKDALNALRSQYEFDENATAELIRFENQPIEFNSTLEGSEMNFPLAGDKVVITYSDTETKEYVYVENDAENEYGFFNDNGEKMLFRIYYPELGDTSFSLNVWDYVEGRDPECTFDVYINNIPVSVTSSINSVSFSPSSITVLSTDIVETDFGQTYYNLWNRNKFIDAYGEQNSSMFKDGDSITVNATDGTKVFTYQTKHTLADGYVECDYFWNGDERLWPDDYDVPLLQPGQNNTVSIMICGRWTSFNVFVDTPELIAQRQAAAAEAIRQGTPGSLPKVKMSKPKASKKAITVKWKKLSKKQLKSGVTNIEIWVSADGTFANGPTIERFTAKKKSSLKIKGLQKGTYYVMVRAVTISGGTKIVGPWSSKTVKVKK